MKTIADLIVGHTEIQPGELKWLSGKLGLSYEELRKVVRSGHVPSDKTLLLYAERLGLDPALLILTAYWQRAPEQVKGLLEPVISQIQGENHAH